MDNNEYISLVLFAGNDIASLEKCLCRILDYTPVQGCELIVVETTADRNMDEYLSRLPNIQLVRYDNSMTAGAGWCRGAELASGENIVFMRDSVWVTNGWLAAMKGVLSANPSAGIAQLPFKGGQEYIRGDVLYASAFCFMVRKKALESVGGFQREYQIGDYGVFDLSARLLKQGWHIMAEPGCPLELSCQPAIPYTDAQEEHDILLFSRLNGYRWGYSSMVRHDMLQMMDYKKPGLKILEIGCACGATLMTIKNVNPAARLYGLELSEPASAIAANFAEVNAGNFETMEREDFDGSFDYVIMGDVLEHLFDTDNALKKVHKWLKPGGRLVVSVPNIAHISILAQQLQGDWEYVDAGILDRTHVRFFTEQTIQLYLLKNGYKVKQIGRKQLAIGEKGEELCQELMELKSVKVSMDNLTTYQIICVAEK